MQGRLGLPATPTRIFTDRRLLPALLILFAAVTVIWDLLNRRNGHFDIDESGYLGIAIVDFRAFDADGPLGWLRQVEAPSFQSPLTTGLTTPVFLLFGPSAVAALLVPLGFTLLTIGTTFALARRIAGRDVAWCATALVASCPVIVKHSRDYHFAPAATAVTTLTLYCLCRSSGLSSRVWSVAVGGCLGLIPLSRTMTVAYIPAIVLAVVILVACSPDRKARLVNACLAALTCLAVAASWLAVNGNGRLVWDYLTAYGYGAASDEYGEAHPALSPLAWLRTLRAGAELIYLPHLVIFAVGAALAGAVAVRRLRHSGRAGLADIARSPLLPVALLVFGGLAALTSSTNKGSAFFAPLVPAMAVYAGWGLFSVPETWFASGRLGRPRIAFVGAVVAIATLPLLPIPGSSGGVWSTSVPGFGRMVVASGQSVMTQYLYSGSVDQPDDAAGATAGSDWDLANQAAAQRLTTVHGGNQLVAFGFRHRLQNPNSINLVRLMAGQDPIPWAIAPVAGPGDPVRHDETWLTSGAAGGACLLLTAKGTAGEFVPIVSEESMTTAAGGAGFVVLDHWALPDGRVVTVWHRPSSCAP